VSEDRQLKRGLKGRHIQLIALGGIISSAYFLGNGYVLSVAGPAAILGYILGGAIILAVMLCLGELAVHEPISGSFVTYARKYISPTWACGVGWSYWLTWAVFIPSEMIAAGIIMNNLLPLLSSCGWAAVFALVLTLINILHVRLFGEVEFWLALLKIIAILAFSVLAVLALFGLAGANSGGFIGARYLTGDGGFFPHGVFAVFVSMVIVLVNFQGSEIIGLTAGESDSPETSIPKAIRNVTWRIIALYVIPMLLLVCIYPWSSATLSDTVFADALDFYGFHWTAEFFSIVVLTAAISAGNSALYAGSRSMYALAREGMAPHFMGKLNRSHVPRNATLVSLVCCWLLIGLYALEDTAGYYAVLLALSGFSGEISWISICLSQINFRKQWLASGNRASDLKFRAPLFPWLGYIAIVVQITAISAMLFLPNLRTALYIGVPMLLLPMLVYRLKSKKRCSR